MTRKFKGGVKRKKAMFNKDLRDQQKRSESLDDTKIDRFKLQVEHTRKAIESVRYDLKINTTGMNMHMHHKLTVLKEQLIKEEGVLKKMEEDNKWI